MAAEWIARDERLPSEADADAQHCVLVWHKYQGVMVTGWHQLGHSSLMTHWMPMPEPPYEITKPKMGGDSG